MMVASTMVPPFIICPVCTITRLIASKNSLFSPFASNTGALQQIFRTVDERDGIPYSDGSRNPEATDGLQRILKSRFVVVQQLPELISVIQNGPELF